MEKTFELIIQPHKGWQAINFREIWLYRELLGVLAWRDIKIRYRQTVLGVAWALLQPILTMLIFTVFFNRVAGIETKGIPYPLFSYTGIIAWTFFANAVSASSNSLLGNQQLISKIYFPRIFIPLGSIGAFLLDLFFCLLLAAGLLIWFQRPISWTILCLPVFILGTLLASSGAGLIFSALNVQFRDIKYVIPFLIQIGLFVTPVIYPLEYIPEKYRLLMGLNPVAGMVSGFRYALLGTPAPWDLVGLSFAVSIFLFIAGLLIFKRLERFFADLI